MKKIATTAAAIALAAGLGIATLDDTQAHDQHGQDGPQGPGMMGPGMQGCGMMGPGMMGPGMGPGMMGPGMMGPMMGNQGMMGPGMGDQGVTTPGMGPGMMSQGWPIPAAREITSDDVRAVLERQLASIGNPHLKVGSVTEKDDATIAAEIMTTEGSIVQKLEVDRRTGAYWQAN